MTYDGTRCVEWLTHVFFLLFLSCCPRQTGELNHGTKLEVFEHKKKEEKFYLAIFNIGNNSKNVESQAEWQVQRCFSVSTFQLFVKFHHIGVDPRLQGITVIL